MSDWPDAMTESVASKVPSVPAELLDEDAEESPAWDRWYERAIAEDVDEALAELGRRLMREAQLQDWPDAVRAECGLEDDGEAMLELAVESPDDAEEQWRELLSR